MDWYVVFKGKPHKGTLKDNLERIGINYFAPFQRVERLEGDELVITEERILKNLIFVQTDQDIRELIQRVDGLIEPYKDCFTNKPALVSDVEMQRFIQAVTMHNVEAQFLSKPFQFFTDRQHVRVKAGDFKGMEGYVVRINRDRKLVIALHNMAVAISGIHYSLLEHIIDEE